MSYRDGSGETIFFKGILAWAMHDKFMLKDLEILLKLTEKTSQQISQEVFYH